MAKIAVSSEGPGLDEVVDPRFGRAAGFMIVDSADMSFEYIDNGASQAMGQGAGIQAAESVARSGAKVVLTGYVGPKAFQALSAAGITIGQNLDQMKVGEAVQAYLDGRVNAAQQANRGSHGR
jgi:predicted Fe-Mo cluster-binding NifX family protein